MRLSVLAAIAFCLNPMNICVTTLSKAISLKQEQRIIGYEPLPAMPSEMSDWMLLCARFCVPSFEIAYKPTWLLDHR